MEENDSNENNKYINSNREFFNRWAWLYDYEKYLFFPLRRAAVKFSNLDKPKKILDVATGTGAQAYEFAKAGHEVIGIDREPSMLAQARKKLNPKYKLSFSEADGTNLPFENSTFDVSVISWSIHEMPFETGIRVLDEMKRVTKETGQILIVDWLEPRKHITTRLLYPLIALGETRYYRGYIQTGLDTYIKDTGLKLVKEGTFLGIWQLVLLTK